MEIDRAALEPLLQETSPVTSVESAEHTHAVVLQKLSNRIDDLTNNSITVRGGKRKLNLFSGSNEIVVTANGVVSNTFVFNLLLNVN